jgi:hypothetical protein
MLQTQLYQAINDVIVAAFLCDTSRLAAIRIMDDFSSYAGDWHADVAHHASAPDGAKQAVLVAAHQLFFQNIYLDLCSKLDVDDGTGKTYLDNSIISWTQESGEYTHNGQGMPIVATGGGGGFLSTGNYVDYADPTLVIVNGDQGNTTVKVVAGLLWQQWLGTVLQAMGLSRTDYETNGLGGYPTAYKFVGPSYTKFYSDAVWSAAGDVLPYLKA